MSEKESTTSKTLGALSAIGKVLSFLEKALIGGFFMMLEFARIKQRKAEVRAADAETKLKIKEEHEKIDDENSDKSPVDIIDNMLAEGGDSDGNEQS